MAAHGKDEDRQMTDYPINLVKCLANSYFYGGGGLRSVAEEG